MFRLFATGYLFWWNKDMERCAYLPVRTFDAFYRHTKFGDSRFRRSWDMIPGIEIENESCDPDEAHF